MRGLILAIIVSVVCYLFDDTTSLERLLLYLTDDADDNDTDLEQIIDNKKEPVEVPAVTPPLASDVSNQKYATPIQVWTSGVAISEEVDFKSTFAWEVNKKNNEK